ncbi:MAG: FprA family A-type flavoprotein [Syntrophales bacterium]|jgi:flavorubredoxin|nr:FprA family A-type flavoprotein [Syntrophales bacterium]MDY0044040.1 FprA family A-type flavoprotein [Syntrophales bacterium]
MSGNVFTAVKVSEHVYWVGAIDWGIRDFHGYATRRGSTYNAYLIIADKITLVDTVRAPFKQEMLARISSLLDPRDISCIISNHAELDHSGCLPDIVGMIRPERVYASTVGARVLKEHFRFETDITAVKNGESISLGNMEVACLETRMLHWPDSMFSYLAEDHILFSQDAFGMHLASSERFDDEIDPAVLVCEAATYYANILLPYSPQVLKLLDQMPGLGLKIDLVAPDHGPVWRRGFDEIKDYYRRWALQKPQKKAVVVYATMWHSTDLMARALAEGLTRSGITVKVMPMEVHHRSDIAFELLDAGALVVGSPTLNNSVFPSMADVLTYLKGLRPQNLIGAAFGSYGWSGEAVKQLESYLSEMKIQLVGESIRAKHVPDADILDLCCDLGSKIGEELSKRIE